MQQLKYFTMVARDILLQKFYLKWLLRKVSKEKNKYSRTNGM